MGNTLIVQKCDFVQRVRKQDSIRKLWRDVTLDETSLNIRKYTRSFFFFLVKHNNKELT